jgi:hypothetical protein
MFVLGFPLLLIPFAVYNMIAFLTPGVGWTAPAATVHLMSDQDWVLTWQDILLAFSVFLLWLEIVKSAWLSRRGVMDHILAIALFIAMLAEFLWVRSAGTSTFFLLMAIALVDVLAGLAVARGGAKRPVDVEDPLQRSDAAP